MTIAQWQTVNSQKGANKQIFQSIIHPELQTCNKTRKKPIFKLKGGNCKGLNYINPKILTYYF